MSPNVQAVAKTVQVAILRIILLVLGVTNEHRVMTQTIQTGLSAIQSALLELPNVIIRFCFIVSYYLWEMLKICCINSVTFGSLLVVL